MKKLSFAILAFALLLVVAPARADTIVRTRSGVVWDSGSVAAGAVIDSPVLDLTPYTNCGVLVDNSGGASTRNLVMTEYSNSTTTFAGASNALRTVGATSRERGVIGFSSSSSTGGISFVINLTLPPWAKFSLAAAGAAAGRVTMWCR